MLTLDKGEIYTIHCNGGLQKHNWEYFLNMAFVSGKLLYSKSGVVTYRNAAGSPLKKLNMHRS